MIEMNFVAILVAALVPMVMGFIYYHKKVVGGAWMKVTGMTEEKARESNMPVIFLMSFIFSIMLAIIMQSVVIHQLGLQSLFFNDFDNELFAQVLDVKGSAFRTFKHGAFHGIITSVFLVLPILGTNALFEQKGWKYIWINFGYWAITLTLMGGIICAWQ
jgi:hypothetical protein